VLPAETELNPALDFDPSDETANTVVRGLQHKYRSTALLLVSDVCAAHCRFCFRKRFTLATSRAAHIVTAGGRDRGERETTFDIAAGVEYIAAHAEIDNVLLTGGDPLMLSAAHLERVVRALREVPHVRIIRIGTKVPVFDPDRVTPRLLDMLASYSRPDARIHLVVHFNHPRELTLRARTVLDAAARAGLGLANQTPLLRSVNADAAVLAELCRALADSGVPPYYVFQCRPVHGNGPFLLTVQEGLDIVEAARASLNGLARRFRYVASHASGKIEIVGRLGDRLVFRYHEARSAEDEGRMLSWPAAVPIQWLDDVVAASTRAGAARRDGGDADAR
jgi:KamA family protein